MPEETTNHGTWCVRLRLVRQDGVATSIELRGDQWPLGRRPSSAVAILRGNLSRHHLDLRARGGRLLVAPTPSSSRTYMNGRPIPVRGEQELAPGDRLYVSDYVIQLVAPPERLADDAPRACRKLDDALAEIVVQPEAPPPSEPRAERD